MGRRGRLPRVRVRCTGSCTEAVGSEFDMSAAGTNRRIDPRLWVSVNVDIVGSGIDMSAAGANRRVDPHLRVSVKVDSPCGEGKGSRYQVEARGRCGEAEGRRGCV